MGHHAGTMPPEVRRVRGRFENWRQSKVGRDRIPEPLWAAAVKLCRRRSVHRVAGWLRLNDNALRDRVRSAERQRAPRKDSPSSPLFAEWVRTAPMPAAVSPAPEYVLELADGLRIRVRGAGAAEVAALAKLLRGERV